MTSSLSPVPYFDLKRQYQSLRAELEAAMTEVACSGAYILSPKVQDFESAFASYIGAASGVGVGSGTDALVLSFRALGIGKGDEVIVPSFTFTASAFGILHAGATPVFADVDAESFTLDPASVEKCINSKTKAILPVQLYGQTAPMDAILDLSKKHHLRVVEDACQAHGAMWKDKKAGSMGDAGCFSFYPTKNLGAFGDGGMITAADPHFVETLRRLRNLGRIDLKEPHHLVGFTSRLDALQAAVLNVKLKHLDEFNKNRRRVASRYFSGLESTPLHLPKEAKDRVHVYHLFVVRVPDGERDALQSYLAEHSITTLQHYPIPVHLQPAVKALARCGSDLNVTNHLSREILSLPIFPEMTDSEVDQVSSVIRSFYR